MGLTKEHKTRTNTLCQFIIHKVKEADPPNFLSDA